MTHQWTDAGLARLMNDVKKENGMEQIKDGGPAFPCDEVHDQTTPYRHLLAHQGMTLRDYFAAKAMQGFLTGHITYHGHERHWPYADMAGDAYAVADAMIAAREGKS